MSDWTRFNDIEGSLISGYVQGYEAKPTTLMAYYIRHKSDIMIPTVGDFIGKYKHLKNNYGIYFLLGDERPIGGKKTIYIGQASEREDTKGMDRIREHLNRSKPDKYVDRWQSVLYITSYENDWSSGVLNTLEKLLIAVFKMHSNYECLNTQDGKDGNVPEQEYRTILQYILDILAMPIFGYELSEIQKNRLRENIRESIEEMLLKVRKQQEEAVREELLDKYSREDVAHLSWSKRVEIYDNFKLNLVGAYKYIYGDRIPFGSSVAEVLTSRKIADNMVNILGDEYFNSKTKFIDIYSKSGVYLVAILDKLMSDDPALPINHEEEFVDKRKRLNHIIQNQLYAICGSLELFLVSNANLIEVIEAYIDTIYGSRKRIRDSNLILPNIICISKFRDIVKHSGSNKIIPIIIDKFKDEKNKESIDLKFDVVIGNPPYNNDIYLDFVELGHKLADKCSCWITPAKWQAKGGAKNEEFRKNIVPYMSEVVFYPDAFELFDVREQDGITVYLLDKLKHLEKEIEVRCRANKSLMAEVETRSIDNTLYGSKIANIVFKCIENSKTLSNNIGVKQSEYVKNTESGHDRYSDTDLELYAGEKHIGYIGKDEIRTLTGLDKWKVVTSVMPVDVGFDKNGQMYGLSKTYVLKPYQVPKGSFPVLKKFDNELEALSFQSYCNARLIRFLYLIGICGKTISEEFWRYIPDPGSFNHIYTDQELYQKYNLTPEEIEIIESIIKERK